MTGLERSALHLFEAEAEFETGRRPREFTLSEAGNRVPSVPGLYVLVRGGRPIYAGQAGKLNEYTARLTYLPNATPERRLGHERNLIRRVNTLLQRTGQKRLKNVQGRGQSEWGW